MYQAFLFICKILEHSLGQLLEHKLQKFSKSKIKDLISKYRHGLYVNSRREAERYTRQPSLQTGDNVIL